ncbi:PREDICTED: protein app1-like [Camelina sativa]|uniref:Protein app1-like n=1 Tax=Camelina sativa TaxID=90675 RepID=A0ABM0YFG9_CAMSA|nr:PREDICTED: protein app1-like [Camelina sativa]
MRSFILTTTFLVALLCFFYLPISTVGLPKEPWRKPLKLMAGRHYHKGSGHLGDSKVSSSLSESNAPLSRPGLLPGFPNIPGIPNIPETPMIPGLPNIPQIPNIPRIPSIPQLPNIPRLPNIPSLPNLPGLPSLPGLPRLPELPPLPPVRSQVVLQSAEVEKCLRTDRSKTSEKCFSQISSSWSRKDFALLDNECCEIVVKLDKKCKSHIHMLFKSPFFVPLLRYSCHIKHTKY